MSKQSRARAHARASGNRNTERAVRELSTGVPDDYIVSATAGPGITAGVGSAIQYAIRKIGMIIYTQIYIDLTGLTVSTTLLDIIGVDGVGAAHLGAIRFAESGEIFDGDMTCMEAPLTGINDIDLYAADENTGVEDTLITALTETQLCQGQSAWSTNKIKAFTGWPTDGQYLYLCAGLAGTPGVYTAGKFMIELRGYEAEAE